MSIRLRLLKCLIGPILLLNLAGGALTYALAWLPAQDAFDQGLADAAVALSGRLRTTPAGAVLDLPQPAEQLLRTVRGDALYFVVRDGAGRTLAGDADFPALRSSASGAYDAQMRDEAVRVASVSALGVQVAVAKTLRKRAQVRAATVRALVLLEGLFTLAIIGLAWFSVSQGLAPLARMRADLKARGPDDLAPIDAGDVPVELHPVASAFNDLLDRVQAGARAQQDFIANVAHQLRTPLAGLKLQLEWLGERHAADAETARSVQLMLASGERVVRQTNQLLALARAEPSRFEKARLEPLDLAALVQETIQYFVEEAGKKGIDIGFDLQPARVRGDHFLLRDLIDNLIDNAIRYTPAHGSVTVRVTHAPGSPETVFVVEDSGPGIAPDQRDRVFSRHVRLDDKSQGSGLGLAIVRDIAQAHGAHIAIDAGPGGIGASFSVRFPA